MAFLRLDNLGIHRDLYEVIQIASQKSTMSTITTPLAHHLRPIFGLVLVCTVVELQILSKKNNMWTLVIQNIGYFLQKQE